MATATDLSRMTAAQEKIDPKTIIFAPQDGQSLFWNARKKLDRQAMEELRCSIRDDGLLEPLVTRKLPNGSIQVVCGERRLRCILALLDKRETCYDLATGRHFPAGRLYGTMDCKVLYNCSDKQASRLSIAENLERNELSDMEIMDYCRQLAEAKTPDGSLAYSRSDICDIIKRSPGWVSQTMSLYNLPESLQKRLSDGTLPRTVALDLLKVNLPQVELVYEEAMKIVEQDAESAKKRAAASVKRCNEALSIAEGNLIGVELGGEETEIVQEARSAKSMADRKLQDAINRKRTAENRQPRLTSDAISRATDNVPGARKGKSTGMSSKSIRNTLRDLDAKLDEMHRPNSIEVEGESVAVRDIELVALGLRMALGEESERKIELAVLNFEVAYQERLKQQADQNSLNVVSAA